MERFLELWSRAALTSLSFFWQALWAFVLGYTVSSGIQVFVTRARMQRAMGRTGPRSVALGGAPSVLPDDGGVVAVGVAVGGRHDDSRGTEDCGSRGCA